MTHHRSRTPILLARLAAIIAFATLTAGCLTSKSYLDPTLHNVKYTDISRRNPGETIGVTAEFQTNGKAKPQVSKMVLDKLVRTLRATGVFADVVTSGGPASDHLEIVMNNVGDIGSAVGKGVGTGLTFGLVGARW